MKKNRMMRLASGLLVAVLATTSMISGTYAKYTTQDGASDVARVAKWGVELQVVGNLYGDTYKDVIVDENNDGANFTVQSLDAFKNNMDPTEFDDVVAPGTENAAGMTFSLKGQPEVDGVVETTMKIQNVFLADGTYGVMIPVDTGVVTEENFDEFTDLYIKEGETFKAATTSSTELYTLEDAVVVDSDYYPVVYNLTGKTLTTGETTEDSLAKAANAIATQLGLEADLPDSDTSVTYTGSKSFESNTDLAGWKVDGLTLNWAWDFGDDNRKGDVGDPAPKAAWTDGADTILGNLENTTEGTVVKLVGTEYVEPVEYKDYCLDTQFSLDITVTQVD